MATLVFTDAIGGVTLRCLYNGAGSVARRFKNWSPTTVGIGDRATAMSTGLVAAAFIYRTEYRVSFEMRYLSSKGPGALDGVAIAQRLCVFAANGGPILVDVEDDVGTAARYGYAIAEPTLTLADPVNMLYTLSLALVAEFATGPWIAVYGGARD